VTKALEKNYPEVSKSGFSPLAMFV